MVNKHNATMEYLHQTQSQQFFTARPVESGCMETFIALLVRAVNRFNTISVCLLERIKRSTTSSRQEYLYATIRFRYLELDSGGGRMVRLC